MEDPNDAPIQHCPLCFGYMLGHPTNSLYKKCPSCGFSYKIGEEAKARLRAKQMKKKAGQN